MLNLQFLAETFEEIFRSESLSELSQFEIFARGYIQAVVDDTYTQVVSQGKKILVT